MATQMTIFGLPAGAAGTEMPKQPHRHRQQPTPHSGNQGAETADKPPASRTPKPDPGLTAEAAATSTDLLSGAVRLFCALPTGDTDRIVVKVPLPPRALELARSLPTPPRVSGEAGRPSTSRALAKVLANALNSLSACDLLSILSTEQPSQGTGTVRVEVDADSLAQLSASAKRLRLTVPQMLGRILAHTLCRGSADPRPPRSLTPTLVETLHAYRLTQDTTPITAQVNLPVVDLTAAKHSARAAKVTRAEILGRLLAAGLRAADAEPGAVLRVLTDPQTLVPPATTRSRVNVTGGLWATVQALATLTARPVDEVVTALVSAGLADPNNIG